MRRAFAQVRRAWRSSILLALAALWLVGGQAAGQDESALIAARRLASELRFEEAVVEYHRYLAQANQPVADRARASFELGFIHLLLGDERNAELRATEALEADPALALPAQAPTKQVQFLAAIRQKVTAKPQLELLPRADSASDESGPEIKARLADPLGTVRKVLLRHALAANGPFYSTGMACHQGTCAGRLPLTGAGGSVTSWYFVEALDADGNTVATAATPRAPAQVTLIRRSPWYQSPWVWGGTAAAVVGIAAVIYATAGR